MANGERIVKLGQNISFEPDYAHDGILESTLTKSLTQGLRNNLLRSHAQSKMQGVGVVHSDVERYTATGGRIIQTPSLEARRKVHRMKNSRGQRLADYSFLDEPPENAMSRGTAQMMIRTER